MGTTIKLYKIKEFIRLTDDGNIDFPKSKKLIQKIAQTAALHKDHHILVDLRDTTVTPLKLSYMVDLAVEFAVGGGSKFKNKIASLIPNDQKRLQLARKFKSAFDPYIYDYQFFTDFEEAIDWLSDTSDHKS